MNKINEDKDFNNCGCATIIERENLTTRTLSSEREMNPVEEQQKVKGAGHSSIVPRLEEI